MPRKKRAADRPRVSKQARTKITNAASKSLADKTPGTISVRGGTSGYAEYLAAISDSEHEQHKELLQWRGPFDPEAFDAKEATREMRKVK